MICKVCNKEIKFDEKYANHHISYFPAVTIMIHDICHKKKNKLKKLGLIKYTNYDYKKFYNINCFNYNIVTRKKYLDKLASEKHNFQLKEYERLRKIKFQNQIQDKHFWYYDNKPSKTNKIFNSSATTSVYDSNGLRKYKRT